MKIKLNVNFKFIANGEATRREEKREARSPTTSASTSNGTHEHFGFNCDTFQQ